VRQVDEGPTEGAEARELYSQILAAGGL